MHLSSLPSNRRMVRAVFVSGCLSILTSGTVFAAPDPVPAARAASAAPVPKHPSHRCDKQAAELATIPSSNFFRALLMTFQADECDSITSTFKLLTATDVPGGRKLQPPTALDRQAAAAEIEKARADAEIGGALAFIDRTETDPVRRKFAQAALFHSEGLYKARDLLVSELRAQAGMAP